MSYKRNTDDRRGTEQILTFGLFSRIKIVCIVSKWVFFIVVKYTSLQILYSKTWSQWIYAYLRMGNAFRLSAIYANTFGFAIVSRVTTRNLSKDCWINLYIRFWIHMQRNRKFLIGTYSLNIPITKCTHLSTNSGTDWNSKLLFSYFLTE